MKAPSSFVDKLLTWPQYVLPHHLLSRLMHYLTRWRMGAFMPKLLQRFVNLYKIDMSSAEEEDLSAYPHFNAFFTRALKPQARPLTQADVLSPVDGMISQLGKIQGNTMIQAKGHNFTLDALLGGFNPVANLFKDGHFCTIYLSPRDYHRIHIPLAGQPVDMIYVPGRLFSVNQRTACNVPGLFARNERVVTVFKTPLGPMALVLVGAIFVGSVDMAWEEDIMPNRMKKPQRWQVADNTGEYAQGAEVGRFNMGSTVIVLFGKQQMEWLSELSEGSTVQMGQALGQKVVKK